MLLALLILICWPIAEVYVAIQVAGAIGALATVLLLIASWPLGTWVVRAQGRAAWRRLRAAVAAGRAPGAPALDGALVLVAGGLLIVPGFISDAFGLLLLAPPTRALIRRGAARSLQSRVVVRVARSPGGPPAYDVDSTASDLDQAQLRR